MELTPAQLLLLNNLMYLKSQEGSPLRSIESAQGETIGSWVSDTRQHPELLSESRDYGAFMTGADWKKILAAVQADPVLTKLTIQQVHRAPEAVGSGLSALITTPDRQEAVLIFKGTESPAEWADNLAGGAGTAGADGVSTPAQLSALEWVRSLDLSEFSAVTVTGHSKGGNKAKYLAVCLEEVTRCVAFDGQGFSEEFMTRYREEIGARQHRIHNYNAASDYVNLLLHDVGETTFCQGYDYGRGGFLENHCPNTILHFGVSGEVTLVPAGRDPRMAALDRWLNRSLGGLTEAERAETLPVLGLLVQQIQEGASPEKILQTLLRPGIPANLRKLLTSLRQELLSLNSESGGDFRIPMPLLRHCSFAVNTKSLAMLAESLKEDSRQEIRQGEQIRQITNQLGRSLQPAMSVRLAAAAQTLEENGSNTQRLAGLLAQIAARYEAAEARCS